MEKLKLERSSWCCRHTWLFREEIIRAQIRDLCIHINRYRICGWGKCIYLCAYVYTFKKHTHTDMFTSVFTSVSVLCIESYNSYRQCQWITRLILAFILCIFVTLPWLRGPQYLLSYMPLPPWLYPASLWPTPVITAGTSCGAAPQALVTLHRWWLVGLFIHNLWTCRHFSLVTPLHLTQALSLLLGCKGWGCCPRPTEGYRCYKAQVPYFKHS